METSDNFEPIESRSIARGVVGGFISGLQLFGRALEGSNAGNYEGRLHDSVMPVEYMDIPDQIPEID